MSSTNWALSVSQASRPLPECFITQHHTNPCSSMKIQEHPLESVSYTALGVFVNMKDSTLFPVCALTVHLWSLFSMCVIHTEKEKNLKGQMAASRINGRIIQPRSWYISPLQVKVKACNLGQQSWGHKIPISNSRPKKYFFSCISKHLSPNNTWGWCWCYHRYFIDEEANTVRAPLVCPKLHWWYRIKMRLHCTFGSFCRLSSNFYKAKQGL